MNDKCAAGTGRFLQSAAAALDLEIPPGRPRPHRASEGRGPVKISTTCTVFAESEVLSAGSPGGRRSRTSYSACTRSIANPLGLALLRRVGIEESEITFTGGVTKQRRPWSRSLDEHARHRSLNVSEESHYMGALGAALFALERTCWQVAFGTGRTRDGGDDVKYLRRASTWDRPTPRRPC